MTFTSLLQDIKAFKTSACWNKSCDEGTHSSLSLEQDLLNHHCVTYSNLVSQHLEATDNLVHLASLN